MPEDRPTNAELLTLLAAGELEVVTRVLDSSNAAYILRVARGGDCVWAVYKPQSGERPLWDFARGLHARERAAFLLSEALGWGLIDRVVAPEALLAEAAALAADALAAAPEHVVGIKRLIR